MTFIEDFICVCVENYKLFVGINMFPEFKIKTKEMTPDKALSQGFDATATAVYNFSTGQHELEIWSNLCSLQINAEYIVFHELTHIWDNEVYSQGDKRKYVSNKGYREYHAAQIDFMKLLGAKNIFEPFSFNMNQEFETIGEKKTAQEFVNMPLRLASALISREDFPANVDSLSTTMGLIFNYYGRRSICKMFAIDYDDDADTSVIAEFLGQGTVKALDEVMQGWFDERKVSYIDKIFESMVIELIKRNKL